jgi:hypothetical protein
MSGPLQRFGRALRGLFGVTSQRPVRTPVGKAPATPYTGPINIPPPPEQRQKALYRVGVNPEQKGSVNPATGERFLTGSLPSKAGVAGALARVRTDRTQVRIYGKPAWDTQKQTSPPPDKLGNVYVTYFAPTAELEQALTAQGTIEDWVAATGGYDFQEALTVYVGDA